MNKSKFLLITLSVLVLSLIVIVLLYEKTDPAASLKYKLNAEQIRLRAIELAPEFGITTENYDIIPTLKINKDLIKTAQTKFGIEKSNEVLADYPFAYTWEVNWIKIDEHIEERKGPIVEIDNSNRIAITFDLKGNLIGLENNKIDTTEISALSENEGIELVNNFINKYTPINEARRDSLFKSDKSVRKTISFSFNNGNAKLNEIDKDNSETSFDYRFAFSFTDSLLGNKGNINVNLYGNRIAKLIIDIDIPEEEKVSGYDLITKISTTVIIGFLILFIAVISFKRIRNYEVNFKTYIPIAVISAVALGLEIYLSSNIRFRWELLIPIIIAPIFYFLFMLFIWPVSDSYMREYWKDKSITFDLIRKGFTDHSLVAKSVLSGIAGGFTILAFHSISIFVFDKFLDIYSFPFDSDNPIINSRYPVFHLFANTTYGLLTTIPLVLLTLPSIIKSRINNQWLIFALFVFVGLFAKETKFFPFEFGIIVNLLSFAVLGFLFLKIDFLSASAALFTSAFFASLIDLYFIENVNLFGIYFFFGLFFITIMAFSVTLFTKDKLSDFDKISPTFVKYITERQRLQGELEVARKVQMSFLPAENPKSEYLDIASNCIPALEVGGDYYDFIKFSKNKLGVVIGDVSGKGTKAAFYMTLTKGFLKAVSKHRDEPSEILNEINEVFYENVERGNFISMAFALFDMENKIVKIARAGHNPILIFDSSSNSIKHIQSKGIAIGLEKGEVFAKSIRTEELKYNSNDIFIFYTDGIPEAMNKNKEEYGMKKFESVILQNSKLNSVDLSNSIYKDVRSFTKNVPQSDDMTSVIVRIK